MGESLLYDEIKFERNVCLEDIINTPDNTYIGYFLEADSKYLDNINEKTNNFQFCPENKVIPKDNFNEYMGKINPNKYIPHKKLVCDWTDKKKYLIQYRMLKFYVRFELVVEKIHEIFSFKQSKWLKMYISFNTQKRKLSKNNFDKDFYKLLNNAFYGKTMENVRNRLRLELFKKDDVKSIDLLQSRLMFNGILKSYETCDSYTFKENEVLMDKQIYLGFGVLDLSKL